MHDLQVENSRPASVVIDRPVYLKENVKIEPLFCRWWAWPHLLSPVQAASNIWFRYLPLLQSFVANPRLHITATRDPRLFGGPFVHLSGADVGKVEELISRTKEHFSRLSKLANDVKAFDRRLQGDAKGFSLNDLYASVPESLAGMIELMYDINNHPRMHLFEELLYAEYGEDLRNDVQEISLSTINESERRFFLSTPRLESAETLTIATEYSDQSLDTLTSMRIKPLHLKRLEETFGLADLAGRYGNFFTDEPPRRNAPDYCGDDVRIRYFGHACVLIQSSTVNILIDPMFASDTAARDSGSSCDRFTISDLPDHIDYLILTHCHHDHFCPEMLLQIRARVRKAVVPLNNRGSIVDPSMKLALAQLGFLDVISLGHFDVVSFEGGKFVSIPFPGEHADLDVYSKQSIFVQIRGRRLLFLVDSDGWDAALYERIAKKIITAGDRIDAIFLGMECHGAPLTWLYGPLLSTPIDRRDDESRRLSGSNCERALRIIQQIKCKRVYVYAMGQEPWLRYLMGLEYGPESIQLTESSKLVSHCRSEGMISQRLYGSQDVFV